MPDASRPPCPPPGNWAEAFAALPQETPPAGRWPAVSAHLEAHRPGRMLPGWLGLAAAAAVVLAVVIPRDARDPQVRHAAPPAADTGPDPSPRVPTPVASATEMAVPTPGPLRATDLAATPVAAAAAATTKAAPMPAAPGPVSPHTETDARMARLYQESAQLEALLALARDQRVGSAGAVLLADAFDARIAGIDAMLANADLEAGERRLLWEARVDALRQAAGFVSTQRLLAVEGHGDAWLVSVD